MKCMVCGKEGPHSVPLSFCAECKKNRRPEVDARIAKHKEWFKQLIKERDASLSQELKNDTIKAVKEWLIKQRVIAEESYAKYDALVIQNLIDRVDEV